VIWSVSQRSHLPCLGATRRVNQAKGIAAELDAVNGTGVPTFTSALNGSASLQQLSGYEQVTSRASWARGVTSNIVRPRLPVSGLRALMSSGSFASPAGLRRVGASSIGKDAARILRRPIDTSNAIEPASRLEQVEATLRYEPTANYTSGLEDHRA